MASGWTNRGAARLLNGDISTAGWKVMLVKTTFTFNKDMDYIDDGTTADPASNEIVATNYTGGFGGSGRKACLPTITEDDASDRVKFVFSNVTWTALGGATNDTIGGAVVFKPGTADTDSDFIFYWDLTDTPTNGSDFVLIMDPTNGNARATT